MHVYVMQTHCETALILIKWELKGECCRCSLLIYSIVTFQHIWLHLMSLFDAPGLCSGSGRDEDES